MSYREALSLALTKPWNRLFIAVTFAVVTLIVIVLLAMNFAEHDQAT